MRGAWRCVAMALLSGVWAAHAQDFRLPGESRPSQQWVAITVYREDEGERSFSLEGATNVTVQVVRDTARLVLHAAVTVSSVRARHAGGDVIASSYEQPQDGSDFLVVSLQQQVSAGSPLVLDIVFNASIGYKEPGFSRYDFHYRGEQQYIYATQFEPNYARRALPCYDEPALKARYRLDMRTKPHLYYDSNTRNNVDEYLDDEGFREFHFYETPPISAYQLSWVLHEMTGRVSSEDVSTVVWEAYRGNFQTDYASHMGPGAVDAMEQLVGVPYANGDIDKMDHMAIPGYIEEGVSGLGIISYSESSVLVDDVQTSEATKERVLGSIQHEVAHQWFGGLVSPRWWDDLWLSEGFASYFQWIAAALVQPTWQLREVFAVNVLMQAAMPADVGPGNYPLFKSPNVSAEQAFDEYFFEKGAAIVWMMENIMGSEAFYRGLNMYLSRNAFMDVWLDLLLSALESEADAASLPEGASLSSVVLPWLQQAGFPLVSVSRNYSDGSAVISQAPYLSEAGAVWPVPLSYTSRSEANYSALPPRLWLLDSEVVASAVALPDDWLLLNLNVSGYYRVNYDEQNWALLASQLLRDPLSLPAAARAQLLDDAASLAASGHLPAAAALRLASYLRLEYGYLPWRAAPAALRSLSLLVGDDSADDFRGFVLSLVQHMAILLRYHEQPGEDHLTRILRAIIVSIACDYGEPECLSSMYEQLQLFMAAPGNYSNQVAPDLKRNVYCYGAQQGGVDAYNFLMELYQITDVASELDDIILGATCSQLVDGLRLLELTAAGGKGGFRREHLPRLLEGLLQQRHHLPAALHFLSRSAHHLSRPGEKRAARKLLRKAALGMRDGRLLDKVQQAAAALEDASLAEAVQWRRDVIAHGAVNRGEAARWLRERPWRL